MVVSGQKTSVMGLEPIVMSIKGLGGAYRLNAQTVGIHSLSGFTPPITDFSWVISTEMNLKGGDPDAKR